MGISDKAYKVLSSIPYLLSGVGITLEITVIALALGTVAGLFWRYAEFTAAVSSAILPCFTVVS